MVCSVWRMLQASLETHAASGQAGRGGDAEAISRSGVVEELGEPATVEARSGCSEPPKSPAAGLPPKKKRKCVQKAGPRTS